MPRTPTPLAIDDLTLYATTGDLGRMVFTLVEVGLLSTQPGDRVEDFEGVFDLYDELGAYEWQGVPGA